jgi:hypothetical protein
MSSTVLESAWQAALAAEQQAVFGYGVAGPHLSGAADVGRARDDEAAHRALLTSTSAELAAAGLTPAAPPDDYPALHPVANGVAARRLAVRLEQDCASAWRYLFAALAQGGPVAAPTGLRDTAQSNLTASAVRAVRWRMAAGESSATVPFPGIGS